MSEAVSWLFAQQRVGIKPGLKRVRTLLELLDTPQNNFNTVLVAGTNGKGSTASTLASILDSSRVKTGLFTSPHLTYFSERFVVNGERLPARVVEAALLRLKPHAVKTEATFFEIVTALACVLFAEAGVTYAVMECGMGGRNDATNVLTPDLSLITNVALDHTKILGDTVVDIARDKAGIMRGGKVCVTTARGAGLDVLKEEAERIGANLRVLENSLGLRNPPKSSKGGIKDDYSVLKTDWHGLELSLGTTALHSPLTGSFQAANVALAAAAAQELNVSEKAIKEGTKNTTWAGRLERVRYKDRDFLLDGAHNPAAATALVKTLAGLPHGDVTLVFGVVGDKDIGGVLEPLVKIARHVIFTRSQLNPRAESPGLLAELFDGEAVPELRGALSRALERSPPDGLILVAGSLYLVGEVRPILLGAGGEGLERWQ